MALVTHVKQVGGMLHLVNDDASVILAYPSANRIWTLPESEQPGPDPDPDPSGDMFAWPVPLSSVSSEYGPRQGGWASVHQGIDLAPGAGYQINAAGSGSVYLVGWHNNFGNWLVIQHPHPQGPLYTVYAHMQNNALVGSGAVVTKGQHVGNVGNTGASFGAHRHFETHVGGLNWKHPGPHMNPRQFFERYNA